MESAEELEVGCVEDCADAGGLLVKGSIQEAVEGGVPDVG